jgi:hypothetical protein
VGAKPKTIDKYLAPLSDEQRTTLEKLRKTIKAVVPKAEELRASGFQIGRQAARGFWCDPEQLRGLT